jgi:hypothetical protein
MVRRFTAFDLEMVERIEGYKQEELREVDAYMAPSDQRVC